MVTVHPPRKAVYYTLVQEDNSHALGPVDLDGDFACFSPRKSAPKGDG